MTPSIRPKNRRSFWCLAALVGGVAITAGARSAPAPAPGPLDLYFIDVEGGAATLLVTPAGESVLVDNGWPGFGGRDAKRIEHVVRYVAGLSQIDHFVATHWHTDHYGGTEELAKRVRIAHYWDRGIPPQATDGAGDFPKLIAAYRAASGSQSHTLKPGDRLPLKSTGFHKIQFTTVAGGGKVVGEGDKSLAVSCKKHGEAPVKDESDNMLSLGFSLEYRRFDFLNLGDLTWNIEHKLACPKNRVGQIDLWQVTHHGASQSGNPALAHAIRPSAAMIVNGPRKGGAPQTFKMLKGVKSLEAVYQLHKNVTSGADDNTSPDKIANLNEKCEGQFFKVRLSDDGETFTVYRGDGQIVGSHAVRE